MLAFTARSTRGEINRQRGRADEELEDVAWFERDRLAAPPSMTTLGASLDDDGLLLPPRSPIAR